MSSRTPMLITPSLGEVIRAAGELDPPMPVSEAKKFWFHYESNGWKVGRVKMVSFAGALGGWHCRWLERQQERQNQPAKPDGVRAYNLSRELERIEQRMAVLERVDSHSDMRREDREEWRKLRAKRDTLRKDLGL